MQQHLLLIGLLAVAASETNAQTQEQKNIMQHAAALYVAEKWCGDDYSVNLSSINRAAVTANIKPDRDPFRAYLKSKIDETQDALSEAGTKQGCGVFYGLYGPKGSAVSGQMMRK